MIDIDAYKRLCNQAADDIMNLEYDMREATKLIEELHSALRLLYTECALAGHNEDRDSGWQKIMESARAALAKHTPPQPPCPTSSR